LDIVSEWVACCSSRLLLTAIAVANAGVMAWPYEIKNGVEIQFVHRPTPQLASILPRCLPSTLSVESSGPLRLNPASASPSDQDLERTQFERSYHQRFQCRQVNVFLPPATSTGSDACPLAPRAQDYTQARLYLSRDRERSDGEYLASLRAQVSLALPVFRSSVTKLPLHSKLVRVLFFPALEQLH
jgi:hypothetical protein